MNRKIEQSELNRIATELLRDCPDESRADHESAAVCIRRNRVELAMSLIEAWPETLIWLKNELRIAVAA